MIHSFSCKNFYSFADEGTVDFVVDGKAPENNGYFVTKSGVRLSKMETVIGPNASGKSHLLRVLPFFRWLNLNYPDENRKKYIPIKPFAFTGKREEATELSVVFEIDGRVYTHYVALTEERIILESLKVTAFVRKRRSSRELFTRMWDPKRRGYVFSYENFGLPKDVEGSLVGNASVISTAAELKHKESCAIAAFLDRVLGGVMVSADRFNELLYDVLVSFGEDDAEREEAEGLLASFDLGFSAFDIKVKDGFLVHAYTVRKVRGAKYRLDVKYESSGTRQMIMLLGLILPVLKKGGTFIIDETDMNFHPDLLDEIVSLFIYPETNPHNAQILFSTHRHRILSRMDRHQITLVEKNKHGMSEAWRLDEVSGVEEGENYYMKYIVGAYGAVPRIL